MSDFSERIAKLSPRKLALLAVELQSRLERAEHAASEPIAIIGMGCRVPGGGDDPESFWTLLRDGVDAIGRVPPDRWDADAFWSDDPDEPGKMSTREGGFIRSVDRFDPHFFGIAPREAITLDPQQRLLLEVSWEALEHAGQPADALGGTPTGVFVGISTSDYLQLQLKGDDLTTLEGYVGTGTSGSVAAGRLSYVLGLQGPAISIDTACSSSLVAVHLACQSLASGECRMALAGGVNLILAPQANVVLSKARMLAPDGRCKTFDASADGFGRGEGCGVVVLKRLTDAIADGDRVLAVIRGTAVNQDGRSSGLTAPNGTAQEALIRRALAKAGIDPAAVAYVEAHGTGTSLGDPIEVQALASVLRDGRPSDRPVLVGSVKTNLGHLEAAAGIAGLIKVVLSLQHDTIPPHLHFKVPNPHIPWSELPVSIPAAPTPWPAGARPRIAGVSSFGFSGTNAHVIVEEAPVVAAAPCSDERPIHLLTLSAKSDAALKTLATGVASSLESQPIADVCFTAATGRSHFPRRLAVVGRTADEVRQKLLAAAADSSSADGVRGHFTSAVAPAVAFLFTGQGSQYASMGRGLYETSPIFRRALDRCDDLLRPHMQRPLLSVLYPDAGDDRGLIDDTAYAQPAIFAIEYALAELMKSWGIVPSIVFGHSVGEYVAACVAGVFELEDALALIAARGRLMQALPRTGAMAAIWASEARVRAAIARTGGVSIAAVNGPESVVISGATEDVQAVCGAFEREATRTQMLNVSHAFHSALMEPMLDEFERVAARVRYAVPKLGLVSNLTGRLFDRDRAPTAEYWRRHAREAVFFSKGVETLAEQGCAVFLEIGPHPALIGPGALCLPEEAGLWLGSLKKDRDDWQCMLGSLARLYTHGVAIDWRGFDRNYRRRKVTLPTYPFERERYWIEPRAVQRTRTSDSPIIHPLLGSRVAAAINDTLFECRLSTEALPFLADHRLQETVVFPASAYIAMSLAAQLEALTTGPCLLEDLVIHEVLVLPREGSRTVQTVLSPLDSDDVSFRVLSRAEARDDASRTETDVSRAEPRHDAIRAEAGDRWRLHATGIVRPVDPKQSAPATEPLDVVRQRCAAEVSVADYYERMRVAGLNFGPVFRRIAHLWSGLNEALGEIEVGDGGPDADAYLIHPAVLDACFQVLGGALSQNDGAAECYLPLGVARVRMIHRVSSRVFSHVRVLSSESVSRATLTADVTLYDEAGRLLGIVEGLQLKRVTEDVLDRRRAEADDWLYRIAWERQVVPPRTSSESHAGPWLVMADATGVGSSVAQKLTAAGAWPIMARAGEHYTRAADGTFTLDPANPNHFKRLFEEALTGGHSLRGAIHAWGLDAPSTADPSSPATQALTCGSVLHLTQALLRDRMPAEGLWVVTRGTQPVNQTKEPLALAQASIWGLCQTIAVEHPELRCVRVDLDGAATGRSADALWREIDASSPEDQVAFRGADRFVARLVRQRLSGTFAVDGSLDERAKPVRLEISERGMLENLALRPLARREPGLGEVELRVAATGLNFRDVLNALGMYPGNPGLLGNECVGTVTAVGEDVQHLNVGDRVAGMGSGTFASLVTTMADLVAPVPSNLTTEEAATIPITFLTVEYALNRLAQMKKGERVLIHAAAGGVGLAAVQVAQRVGAEIFATAGTPEKRALLASLGVQHVMDSRSLAFADEVMGVTNGEGIDIVLNSLAGEFIPKSLGTLRAGGRFLELGKTDIWDAGRVAEQRPDVAYHAIYLGEVAPSLIQTMLRALLDDFATGALKPLPYRTFTLDEAADAFRFMAQAKHIGKVVIVPGYARTSVDTRCAIQADRAYLITGGYGALGLVVAKWLADRGARHIALVGRRGPSDEATQTVHDLTARGVQVAIVRGDVANAGDVARVLGEIASTLPPLAGIVHAAGSLNDRAIVQQSWEGFSPVFAPKVDGAWHLHQLTRDLPLDFFVLFSSTSAVLGNAGQSNYAAANAFLDALAHQRRAEGLPAISIDWGPWAESGMAASVSARSRRRLNGSGISEIPHANGVAILERAIAADSTQLVVLPVNWPTVLRSYAPGREPRLFAAFTTPRHEAPRVSGSRGRDGQAELMTILDRTDAADRPRVVLEYVNQQAARVLGIDPARPIDPNQGLRDLGLDSLLAIELRNRLQRGLGQSLPATLAFDCPTVKALAKFVGGKAIAAAEPVKTTAAAARAAAPTIDAAQPIAVIGLGCRIPGGASNPETFWRLLTDGFDAITDVPRDRWDVDTFYDDDPDAPGKMYTRRGAFLDRVDLFDPQFFRISPREAVGLDPQQRLLLEVSWEAIENAGLAPDRLLGSRTGVFVGIGTNEYAFKHMAASAESGLDPYFGTGNSLSVAAGRLSYVLGLQGPAMSIDTACSSSLVAVHLACKSLRGGESRLALAGGVNVMLLPQITAHFCRARMMAADGRCKTFDAAADGYVRGEGCGVVVLKRLSDAIVDNDRILAVIRGTAVNQDGRSSGLTVPNGPAQQSVLRDALQDAGVKPADVSYVEAHGTGTSLGDPIEVQALDAVFGEARPADRPLIIGSVKTNVGHLEAAAGIVGLLKLVLAVHHGEIPKHLHFQTPNPHIPWSDLHVEVASERRPWPEGRRIGAISSFGFSGTNAHAIVEQAPAIDRASDDDTRPAHIVTMSARNEEALSQVAARVAERLTAEPSLALRDIASTLNTGRAHFDARLAAVATSVPELATQLRDVAAGATPPGTVRRTTEAGVQPSVAFLFTGQGSQYVGMARQLYETAPTFRAALDRCAELLKPHLARPLLSVIYAEPQSSSLLDQTMHTQPALFAIEVALAEAWREWGIQPDAVMGHSIGEYAAACVAGVFSLEDGLKLVAARGRLMQALTADGTMAAIFAGENRVRAMLAGRHAEGEGSSVSIAAANGPDNTVISGARQAVDDVIAAFAAQGIQSERLTVSHAFHSALMDPMLDEFERIAASVRYAAPRVKLVSNLTGEFVSADEIANAGYWRRHAREAVRFGDGLETLRRIGCDVFVELGPSPILLGMAQRSGNVDGSAWLPSLWRGRADWTQMLESLSALYVRGVSVDWQRVDGGSGRRIELPTYPFQRERYWIDEGKAGQAGRTAGHDNVPFDRIAGAAARAADAAPLDLSLHTFATKWECLDRLTTAFVVQAFRNLGAFTTAGERRTIDEMIVAFGILPLYRKVVRRWLQRLASDGLLREENGAFVALKPLPASDLDAIGTAAREAFGDLPLLLEYVERGGRRLVPVLTGKEGSLETLFPDGSFAIAESLYETSPAARYFNGIVRSIVEAAASIATPERRLRVLEIGAGVGGTTAAVVPALIPDRVVYYFTDLSNLFLLRAEDRFRDYPFLRYSLLDIEQSPEAQGIPTGSFDVVVATNVLHATPNLHDTLANVRSLLAPGGLLVLNEATDHPAWFDLGLVEGWQRFDDDVRTESPTLPVDRWCELLLAEGFHDVAGFPRADSPARVLGQHVIAATVPGTVGGVVGRDWRTMLDSSATGRTAEREQAVEAFVRALTDALPAERVDLLIGYVRDHVAAVLRLGGDAPLERRQRLMDLGLDSLMAVELRNRLASGLRLESLPATLMFDYPTIEAIAGYLEREALGFEVQDVAPHEITRDDRVLSDAVARLAELSDEEAEALLLEKLGNLQR